MAPSGPTNPEAGVIVPSPATMPVTMPSTLGLPNRSHSAVIQASAPVAAPRCVTRMAIAAELLAARALPPLKPNQPTHSIPAPRIFALAQHQRAHQGAHPRGHVYDDAAREVEHSAPRQPAPSPHPVAHRQIHDDEPQ